MKIVLLLLLPLALAACTDPGGYSSYTSPQERLAQAEGQIRATDAARVEQAAQATQQAAKEAGKAEAEIRRVMAPIQASQTAVVLKATEIAQAAAVAALEAQQAETAKQVELAAIEIERTKRREAIAATINDIWQVAWLALRIAIGGAFALLLYFLPSRWVAHYIQQQQQKNSLSLLSDGIHTWPIWFDKQGIPQVIGSPAPADGNGKHPSIEPRTISGVWGDGEKVQVVRGVSASVAISRIRTPGRDTTGQAIAWVRESIRQFGQYKDQLVSDRQMGWGASKWTRIKDSFGATLETVDGVGTFIGEGAVYQNLAELEQALVDGRLELHPPPTPSRYPVAGD